MTTDTRTPPRSRRFPVEVLHPWPRMERLEPRWLLSAGGVELPEVLTDNGAISGQIYEDLNGSTTLNADELGLDGWAVQLLDGQDTVLQTIFAKTDAEGTAGTYAFTSLAQGNYEVRVIVPSTWAQTGPTSITYSVSLGDGQQIQNIDFGAARYGTISGQKFNDVDADRQWGPAETPLNGWTIELYDDEGVLVRTQDTANVEGDDGSYVFAGLLPGTYELWEVSQDDWFQTTPQLSARWLTLTSGQDMTGVNIGNTQVLPLKGSETAAISGLVFEDLNGSASYDKGEPGLGQWAVQLLDARGGMPQTILTDTAPAGTYAFTGLAADAYRVRVIVPSTWVQTSPTPTTYPATLADGQQVQVNFGSARYCTVSGRKFNDVDGDGAFGSGELGLNAWTIQLYDSEGGLVDSQATATADQDDGSYMFADLPPGTYELREIVQAGWVQTAPLPAARWLTLTSSQDLADVYVGNRRSADAVDDASTTIIDPDNPTAVDVLANDLYLLSPIPAGLITGVTDGDNGTTTIVNNGRAVAYLPGPGFTGNDSFTYTVTDAGAADTATANVTVVDTRLPNQQMHHATDQLQLDLAQTTVPGQTIAYSAAVFTPDAYVRRLQQQQIGLTVYLWPWDNWHGHQEKWLQDAAGDWFYMLPDGGLYRGGTNELLAQIGQTYYDDPWKIINGLPSGATEPEATAGVAGDELTLDPQAGFVGVATVELTATFGPTTVVSQFNLAVTNTIDAPGVVDEDMSHLQDTLDLPPQPITDGQGEALTYSATLALPQQAAYNIKQGLGLVSYVPLFDNYRNLNEKWFLDNVGNWYYMLDSGGVFHPATGLPVGRTSQTYYDDPQALIDAVETLPLASSVTVAGNQVTVDPAAAYAGWLQIEVRVQDGTGWAATTIQVEVTNILPDLSFLTDRQMTQGQGPLVINLPQTDGESENVSYALAFQTTAVTAYQLDQAHGLVGYWSPWDNNFGQGAKWLWDGSALWYYLLPGGRLYRHGSGQLLGQVATGYYDDPATLVNAPLAVLPNVALALPNGSLTIAPDAEMLGTFQINLEADDTIQTTDSTFNVTVVPD